ncbi:hypothetical protein GCM10009119_40040 [Algoriphagus jejuensis]|uniref:Uncharacterized protein n=1 Tax=Algoriphagus jejuensis TaxID=419934 RepID=A0ABP3YKG6_9BACT
MNLRNKSIVLVDQLQGKESKASSILIMNSCEVVTLDPEKLLMEQDWTRFEDDVDVIKKIYSHVFEEVVLANKKLACFWPLSEQFGSEWFELTTLCKANDYELEVYKNYLFDIDSSYGLGGEIIRAWKKFVYFLIESLLADIELTEGLEEIGTLTSAHDSIVLFRLEYDDEVKYTFAFNFEDSLKVSTEQFVFDTENSLPEFRSFPELLLKLLANIDLIGYQAAFSDPHLEKTYFNTLMQEFKSKNLIESWLETYSLN